MRLTALLVFLTVFLVACSSTNVVKIDEKPTEPTEEQPSEQAPATDQTPGGAEVSTSGKTVSACDDTDLNDPNSVGAVYVDYSDGTQEVFYDKCVSNSFVLTEYKCEGKEVRSQNFICKQECINIKIKDQASCPGCTVGFCT